MYCRARLNTLMVAKPEKGRQVEAMLCQETKAPPSPHSSCQCYGSGIFIPDPNFFHSEARIQGQKDSDSGSASKNLSTLTQKLFFKLFENMIRVIPDLMFSHPGSQIQGSKKEPDPGSGSGSASLVLVLVVFLPLKNGVHLD
jgi:hypothetical protein